MKQVIVKLFVLVAVFGGTNQIFGQSNSNADNKLKEDALKLINLPEPLFKSFAPLSPQVEQTYQNTPVNFQMKDGKNTFARKFSNRNAKTTVILVHGVLSDSSAMNKAAGLLRQTLNLII